MVACIIITVVTVFQAWFRGRSVKSGKAQRMPPTPDNDKITTLHAMQHESPPSNEMTEGNGRECVLLWHVNQTPFPH